MKIETELQHLKHDYNEAKSSVSPIFQCSAFDSNSDYFYSRKNNPNIEELEKVICCIESSKFSLAFSTGMTAIYITLSLLKPGSHLIINKHIYGCSYKLFQKYCERLNINLKIIDLSNESEEEISIKKVDMVIFETPTNPFLKTIDIQKTSTLVKSINPDALIIVDNTWATPLYQNPLTLGADLTIYSATKYFSGHSDVMGGIVTTNNALLYEKLLSERFYSGSILSPYSAWLLSRSMKTFSIRMKRHSETTREIISKLKNRPYIDHIYYPEINDSQLKSYGGIIFIEVPQHIGSKYNEIIKELKYYGTGTGMACVTSMIAKPYTGSHASMTAEEKKGMGITENLIRLCFGLEDPEDLILDLDNAIHKSLKETSST
ncbi:PLP-dependent aspartate aminotransferase family protein [Vreelandella titanicae]|uniref:trans-sulfuration enzyme family protein n=1 Tax=Vreelandella titanicae TaxID=664683 RepID=UPI00241C6B72|nr:PLP-dependent aspartate aminotransferase family protein [Halomonas titanicae]